MLVVVLLLSALTLWTLRSLLPAVLLGAWLAAVAEPMSAFLARRFGGRSRAATALVLGVVMALLSVVAIIALPVVADLGTLVAAVRHLVATGQGAANITHTLGPSSVALPTPQVESNGAMHFVTMARDLAPLAEGALSAAASVAIQLFVFVVTAYYLAIDGRRLQAGVERVSPLGAQNTRRFVNEFIAVGRGIALSVGFAGLLTATMLGTAFWLVDAPRPFLLAALAFIAAMLPIGAHIVWIPVACWLVLHDHPRSAMALAIVGIFLVGGFVDHVVRPYLVRFGRLELHPLLTVLGLFGGVVAFGAWGVFIGPLLVAMTATAMRIHADRPILARRSLIPGERVTMISVAPGDPPIASMLPVETEGMMH